MVASKNIGRELKTKIIRGEYKPGKVYSEKEIIKDLSASRTPVRESLKVLAGEGLVKFIPKRGILISPVTIKKIKDIYEVRRNLEKLAVEKAIEKCQESDIEYLSSLNEQYKKYLKEQDYIKTFNIGKKFHLYIAKISRNESLYQLIKKLRDESYRGLVYLVKQIYDNNKDFYKFTAEQVLKSHGKVIDALKDRDKNMAIKYLLDDINLINIFLPLIKNEGIYLEDNYLF